MFYAEVRLGIGRARFMRMTPRLFDAWVLLDQKDRERQRRERDVPIAVLTAMVANTGFKGFEEPRLPSEFLPVYPSDDQAKPIRKRRESFDQQMRRTMERAMAYQAGQVARGL